RCFVAPRAVFNARAVPAGSPPARSLQPGRSSTPRRPPPPPMKSHLLLDVARRSSADGRTALAAPGLASGAAFDCHNLVQRTTSEAPEQVVCVAEGLV